MWVGVGGCVCVCVCVCVAGCWGGGVLTGQASYLATYTEAILLNAQRKGDSNKSV